MPVTAKLSLKFYEKLGEEVATELVEWFNAVDATYRSDLRELNELNFARFDAKLEQRLTEQSAMLRSELRAEFREVVVLEVEGLRREMHEQGRQLANVDMRLTSVETRLSREIERVRSSVIKWSFVFYIGTALTVLGLKLF